ncbi:LacI family DNA-binding transcriptional regulator, partial [Rhizobium ruizarguesonis]
MKVTLKDVARQAGDGTETEERVINGRDGVRPETVEKVLLAARRLEYRLSLPVAHRGLIRIEVILVRPETSFYSRLNRAFERIAASLDDS